MFEKKQGHDLIGGDRRACPPPPEDSAISTYKDREASQRYSSPGARPIDDLLEGVSSTSPPASDSVWLDPGAAPGQRQRSGPITDRSQQTRAGGRRTSGPPSRRQSRKAGTGWPRITRFSPLGARSTTMASGAVAGAFPHLTPVMIASGRAPLARAPSSRPRAPASRAPSTPRRMPSPTRRDFTRQSTSSEGRGRRGDGPPAPHVEARGPGRNCAGSERADRRRASDLTVSGGGECPGTS